MEAGSAEGDDPEEFVVGVEGEGGVEEAAGVETGLLSKGRATLVRRVGRSCLYLLAASLLLKMSSKLSAGWGGRY